MAMQELDYLQGARMASGGPPWSKDGPGMEVSSVWRDLVAQFHERANVGEEAPDFTGELLGGSSVSLRSYRSKRNVLLIFGSYTDPPCRSNLRLTRPSLVDLYRQYEKAVTFLWIYTREAHPGKLIPQQASLEVKRCNAERLRDEEGVPFPIVVDAFEGTIHQLYGPAFNNAVFLINKAGIIVYRTMFLDASALAEPLADLVEWQWMDADNRVIKKSYSEQIRMVREPYDPECQQRILKVLEATNGPLDFEQMRAQRGFDLRDWRRSGG